MPDSCHFARRELWDHARGDRPPLHVASTTSPVRMTAALKQCRLRWIACVARLIFQGYPDDLRSTRHLPASSPFYDELRNPMRATGARRGTAWCRRNGIARLDVHLRRGAGGCTRRACDAVFPLAAPLSTQH